MASVPYAVPSGRGLPSHLTGPVPGSARIPSASEEAGAPQEAEGPRPRAATRVVLATKALLEPVAVVLRAATLATTVEIQATTGTAQDAKKGSSPVASPR